ncbi:cytidine deaminase-like [Venturia canescens]|uniref:cytidine deaminase-like n=1 Tax=Venturia canescens TaxID=32260 RepID=UPI001C9C06B7|nr:cytidine deaminase-like [Venturia canescens]
MNNASRVIDFETLAKDDQELIEESMKARELAYAPYSKFKVGAALRCTDKTIARGCNVENASYAISTCAERAALCRAISDGKTKFTKIAVTADKYNGVLSSPCGMCRQALAEFGDMIIYLVASDLTEISQTSVGELLPMGFGFNNCNSSQKK